MSPEKSRMISSGYAQPGNGSPARTCISLEIDPAYAWPLLAVAMPPLPWADAPPSGHMLISLSNSSNAVISTMDPNATVKATGNANTR